MKRFIIATSGRCGFHFLQSMLNKHPEVMCVGEFSNFLTGVGSVLSPERLGTATLIGENEPIDEYIDVIYKKAKDMGAQACGFKISYAEFRNWTEMPIHWMHFWKFFRDEKIHVINLLRRSSFERYLSFKLAKKNSFYGTVYEEKVTLSLDDYLFDALDLEKHIFEVRKYLEDNPQMIVFYEDLCVNRMTELSQICKFLEVNDYGGYAEEDTLKQMTRNHWEYVENYHEIMADAQERLSNCKEEEACLLRSLLSIKPLKMS
jgi:hypothetical protein